MDQVFSFELYDLVRKFGDKVAVDGIFLQVPRGTFFGLVGPNGAGKTTTFSMATGLMRPTSGQAYILGQDVWHDPPKAKALMGVLPDGLQLFDRLSGKELLITIGRLRNLSKAQAYNRAEELIHVLGLKDDASTMVADYSAGMTKKIGLGCALIHAPKVLILDEPFESIDPVSGQVIREILKNYVAGGGTVVMSSHVMELVESLCSALAVMNKGKILAAGTLDEVRQGMTLQDRFVQLVGGATMPDEGELSWLRS